MPGLKQLSPIPWAVTVGYAVLPATTVTIGGSKSKNREERMLSVKNGVKKERRIKVACIDSRPMWCSMSQRGGAALTAVLSSLSRRTISATPSATSFCATAPYFRMITIVPVAQPYAARLFQVQQLHASLATTKKRRGGAGVAKNGKSTGNDNDASTSGGGDEMAEVEEWDGHVPRSRIGVTASRSSGTLRRHGTYKETEGLF